MKRALSLIVVLAMVLCMVPAAFAADETLLTLTDQAVTADEPYVFEWTATADGTVKVNASPAFASGQVNACWKATIYSTKGGEVVYEEGSYQTPGDMWMTPNTEYNMKKGQHLVLTLGAQKGYVGAAGTISATVTFGGATVQKVKEAWDDVYGVNGTDLTQTADVTLVETAEWTKFIFTPAAIGEYTLSVDSGVIVYCGANTAYCPVPGTASSATSTSITREIKSVGNSVIFAIKGDNANVKVTIAKTGDSEGVVETVYEEWETVHTPNKIHAGLGNGAAAAAKVDITEAHTVVKISDSEYRLDSTMGPVIYVDLSTNTFDLGAAFGSYGALSMRGVYEGKNYDWKPTMSKYYAAASNGYYPLTTDLIAFYKGYGNGAGMWYDAKYNDTIPELTAGTANADSLWMFACYAVEPTVLVLDGTTKTLNQSGTGIYHYAVKGPQGNDVVIEGEGLTAVEYNGVVYTAENNKVTLPAVTTTTNAPASIKIIGKGAIEVSMVIPVGTYSNPAPLAEGNNVATTAGNMDGYYYTYTAEKDGTLTLIADGEDVNVNGWFIQATCGYAQEVADYLYDDTHPTTLQINVKAGDEVLVNVNTVDITGGWDTPAGTVSFTAIMPHDCVKGEYPEFEYNETWTEFDKIYTCEICGAPMETSHWYVISDQNVQTSAIEYTTPSIAAGATANFSTSGTGMTLTLAADDITLVINGETQTAVDGVYTYEMTDVYGTEIVITNNGSAAAAYDMVFSYPLGVWQNPDELPVGETDELTFAAGDEMYSYAWTATCPGTLTITVEGEQWMYMYDYTAYDYDYNPGENTLVIDVVAGQVVTLDVGTWDPAAYGTADGTISVTASFAHSTEGAEVLLEPVAGGDHTFGNMAIYGCATCGCVFNDDGIEVDPENVEDWLILPNHVEIMVEVEEVKPTTEADGMKEHIYCPECDKYFVLNEDAENYDELIQEVTKASLIIPKTATPVTGDTFALVAVIALVVLSAMGIATVIVLKKRKTA